MKILLINSVCGIGSTGKICAAIAEEYEKKGYVAKIAYGRDGFVPKEYEKFAVRISSNATVKINALQTRVFDNHGFALRSSTKRFLKWAEEFNPDILWLHNIHGYYIHIGLLFDWIKSRPNMQVKWTLHDCWAFTGHCSHFTAVHCEKWKTHCDKCPQTARYPASIKDNSKRNFDMKKAAFTGVKNMTLITPSKWLADLVKQSFLGEYPIEVHYNPIDKNIFKPTKGNFREKYGLAEKKIILGVASVWDDRKGLDIFIELSESLDRGSIIVLVGLNEEQINSLPCNILGIKRTHNATELAEIYTAADVFVNPSIEETFGMTTVEAVYCGTPAIVYKGTACEEIVEKYGGIAVEPSKAALLLAIKDIIG